MTLKNRKKWLEQLLFDGPEEQGAGGGASPNVETDGDVPDAPVNTSPQGPTEEELMRSMAGLEKPEETDTATTAVPVSVSETATTKPAVVPVTTQEATTKAPAPVETPAPALTAADLKSVLEKMPATVAEAIKAGQPQPAAAPQPAFKPWRPSPALVEKIFEGGEAAVAALGEISDQSTIQAVQIVAPYFEQRIQAINDYIVGQERQQAKVEFAKQYPDLEPFTDAAEEYANKLLGAGQKFATRKDLFEKVAAGVREIVKSYEDRIAASKSKLGLAQPTAAAPAAAIVPPPSLPAGTASPNGGHKKSDGEQELMKLMANRSGAR